MKLAATTVISAAALCSGAALGQTVRYVWTNSPAPDGQYLTWATAARTIQDAVNAAAAGDTIIVTNGIYDRGGTTNWPAQGRLTNQVAIWKAVTVRSVNGPEQTFIKGKWNSAGTNGRDAVRCVYLGAGAKLVGFTITNGATLSNDWSGPLPYPYQLCGGGLFLESTATASNCNVTGNSAYYLGAGTYSNPGGALYNCTVKHNTGPDATGTVGGGVYGGNAYNCLIYGNSARDGGGARAATLYNCMVLYNTSHNRGGGVEICHMYNCLVAGNSSPYGGGVYMVAVGYTNYNCTIVGNWAGQSPGGVDVHSAANATLINCIIRNNTGWPASNPNCNTNQAVIRYCCTWPLAPGEGNIDADPIFIDPGSGYGGGLVLGDYRLTRRSPCINRGMNFPWQELDPDGHGRDKDLDGEPRRRGTVDIGAYELWIRRGSFFFAE